MNATPEEQARKNEERLKRMEEEVMNFRPRHFTGKDSQEDIRKIARQEMLKILREYGFIK